MLGLSEDAAVSALGLASNCTVGLNEWAAAGADDMFFHAGFAARNAVTSVELAELGMVASETALDGPAGLFATLGRTDRIAAVHPFSGKSFEIFDVYHKPAPACNYAQTACQAALAIAHQIDIAQVAAIKVRCSAAAIHYPGCSATGPFERVLQAKMSIRFCVAATLARRSIEENNYRQLNDLEIVRLVGITELEEDAVFTSAYPGQQGSEIIVTLRDGQVIRHRMDDLVPANPDQIRARFRSAAGERATSLEAMIEGLDELPNVSALGI
jgi:2-methylcitrate dehydratase PrpD